MVVVEFFMREHLRMYVLAALVGSRNVSLQNEGTETKVIFWRTVFVINECYHRYSSQTEGRREMETIGVYGRGKKGR